MLEQQIILFLFYSEHSHTTLEISSVVGELPEVVQKTLHKMDDRGDVIMKNGLYKISSHTKRTMKD
jgi:predicted transcriptional regulator